MIKVYIDMDGVLANFDKALIEPLDENGDPPEMFRPGFFRNLEVVPGAKEAIEALLLLPYLDIMVGSKHTTKTDYCVSEKLGWLREHFPMLVRKTYFVTDKANLIGDWLLDDDPKWKTFEGNFYLFDKRHPEQTWTKFISILKTCYE